MFQLQILYIFQNMAKRLNLKDKMEEINERFSYKNKSTLANDVLENKLINIRKKMNSFAVKNQQEMAALRTDAIQLLAKLQQNNAQYELEAEAQLRDLQQLSQELTGKIEGEIILRKEKENQLVSLMEKKLRMLKNEIEKEKKQRTDIVQQISSTLKNDVPCLMNEVIQNSTARQEEEEKLAEIIEGELSQCQTLGNELKAKQQESCTKIYGLIRELTLKAKKQVQEEKAIRDQTHEQILTYIEQTCNKLAEV